MTRTDRSFGGLLLALAAAAQALAQPASEPTALERAAEAAFQAVPDADAEDWELGWDATGIRMSPGPVTWHLANPDPPDAGGVPPTSFRRTGWVSAGGRSLSVAVCGDAESVGAMAIRFSGDAGEALAAAFSAQGATLKLLESRRAPEIDDPWDDEAYQLWRSEQAYARYALTRADKRAATLDATLSCTSPRSRAAQSCWTDARLVYAPGVDGAAECRNPGRY